MTVSLSFRARILALVLLVAVAPLGIVGFWLTGGISRSGEALLIQRVERALDATVDEVVSNWVERRSQLLALAEDLTLAEALRETRSGGDGDPQPSSEGSPGAGPESRGSPDGLGNLRHRFLELGPSATAMTIFGSDGLPRWHLARGVEGEVGWQDPGDGTSVPSELTVGYRVTVWEGLSDTRLGAVEIRLDHRAFLPLSSVPPQAAGMVFGLFDSEGGWSIRPTPFDPDLLSQEEFVWGGDRWVTRRRTLREPPLAVVVSSPASPVMGPFREGARRGGAVLLLTAFLGLLAAAAISRRLTRSLEGLSGSAQALSGGDFSIRIEPAGRDEVGVVAEAFNLMAQSLQETLDTLSRKESLAAVGEFAASLAHEVRNPLTAIRIDLQKVLAGLPPDSEFRPGLQRSLIEVEHLNSSIEATLRQARTGRSGLESVDLMDVIRFAAEATRPFFEERRATLTVRPLDSEPTIRGDTETLRQAFLNVIRNAAEALGPGGSAVVSAEEQREAVEVTIADTGSGIPVELQKRIFEPLFTTRSGGTGLGLTIVKRIVEAHDGTIRVESEPGRGTRVHLRLPTM